MKQYKLQVFYFRTCGVFKQENTVFYGYIYSVECAREVKCKNLLTPAPDWYGFPPTRGRMGLSCLSEMCDPVEYDELNRQALNCHLDSLPDIMQH